jgi:hypothetical protein
MSYTDILTRQKDIGKNKYNHEILVKGSDLEACKRKGKIKTNPPIFWLLRLETQILNKYIAGMLILQHPLW